MSNTNPQPSLYSQINLPYKIVSLVLPRLIQRIDSLNVCHQVMWRAVERALGPSFSRDKCEVKLVGSPLTHQRYLRRHRGTFGPSIEAGKGLFPGHSTPIPQLYCCGDSTFPGIGVPPVAASGAIVANSLVSVSQHSELLDAIGI